MRLDIFSEFSLLSDIPGCVSCFHSSQKEFLEVLTPLLFPLFTVFLNSVPSLKEDFVFQSRLLLPAKTNNANL